MQHPLDGLRVLDHGHVWAGPLLGMMLSDMGAEVIKVQAPLRRSGIAMGGYATYEDALKGDTVITRDHPIAYHGYDRGKLSITLDLSQRAGRETYFTLAAISDIVIENFAPGVMDRLGLGFATLQSINQGIIVAALSAAGATPGPWRDIKTYGPSVAAIYGMKSFLGYLGDPCPREDTADVDPNSAGHALVAILAALECRDTTGLGQYIDLAQGEAALQRAAEPILDYFMNGIVAKPQGNRYPGIAPHGIYRCADVHDERGRETDRWVSIEVRTGAEWNGLVRVLAGSVPEIGAERFQALEGRLTHQDELDAMIEQWTRSRSADDVTMVLQEARVAAYPVQGLMDLVNDENYQALRTNVNVDVSQLTAQDIYQGIPWKLERTAGTVRGPVPQTGEHNDFVFRELLGFSHAKVMSLRADGVTG